MITIIESTSLNTQVAATVQVTTVGNPGPQGIQGPAGPSAVSTDAGNTATLGTDDLIYVPAAGGGETINQFMLMGA